MSEGTMPLCSLWHKVWQGAKMFLASALSGLVMLSSGFASVAALTACGGYEEVLETLEEPTANNHASKPANDSTAVAAKKAMAYTPMSITYLKPEEILPIVGQLERGDKKAYEHIEHLGIAEGTKIRDMMWKY